MTVVQHKDIPNSQLHEPKGANTATLNTTYFADGIGSGVWRKATPSDIDNSDKTKNTNGWNDIADSLYTSGSPRAIASGVRTALTNNGLKAQTDVSRLGSIWSNVSNAFTITDPNAMYMIRISGKVVAAAAAGTPYILTAELETASGPTVLVGTVQPIKGGSAINQVTINIPFYIGSIVNGQALKIYVTPDTNITMYDIGFVIQRTYKEV